MTTTRIRLSIIPLPARRPAIGRSTARRKTRLFTLQKGSALDADAHDWEVTVKPNADGKTATITSTCKNCHKTETISNATLVSDTTTYPEGGCCLRRRRTARSGVCRRRRQKIHVLLHVAKKDHVVLDQETARQRSTRSPMRKSQEAKSSRKKIPNLLTSRRLKTFPRRVKTMLRSAWSSAALLANSFTPSSIEFLIRFPMSLRLRRPARRQRCMYALCAARKFPSRASRT